MQRFQHTQRKWILTLELRHRGFYRPVYQSTAICRQDGMDICRIFPQWNVNGNLNRLSTHASPPSWRSNGERKRTQLEMEREINTKKVNYHFWWKRNERNKKRQEKKYQNNSTTVTPRTSHIHINTEFKNAETCVTSMRWRNVGISFYCIFITFSLSA